MQKALIIGLLLIRQKFSFDQPIVHRCVQPPAASEFHGGFRATRLNGHVIKMTAETRKLANLLHDHLRNLLNIEKSAKIKTTKRAPYLKT